VTLHKSNLQHKLVLSYILVQLLVYELYSCCKALMMVTGMTETCWWRIIVRDWTYLLMCICWLITGSHWLKPKTLQIPWTIINTFHNTVPFKDVGCKVCAHLLILQREIYRISSRIFLLEFSCTPTDHTLPPRFTSLAEMIKLLAIIKQRLSRETVSRATQMKALLINNRVRAAAWNEQVATV
jgi:hypothetical protein